MSARDTLGALRLAVVFGGHSSEREVSLHSAATVLGALRDGGYEPEAVDSGDEAWWKDLADVDLVFNIQHGPGGEDGVTQGLLAAMGIAVTGSDVLGSALAMDKLRSKRLWRAEGLPTAEFVIADETTDAEALLQEWGTAFVKPACEGSSIGMTRVATPVEFAGAVAAAKAYDRTVIAEQFIDGPEYTVAILGERTLPSIRIEAAGEFYDYQAKYHSDSTRYHLPSGLSAGDEKALAALATKAFESLGCDGWGRVDVMRDRHGDFQLLEVNTVPGMTSHSLVPMAARAAGMSLLELVEEILVLAWQAASVSGGGR